MKFVIYNGTLKADVESNTSKVVKMLQLAFEKLGQECEVVTMAELNYQRGTADIDRGLVQSAAKEGRAKEPGATTHAAQARARQGSR